MHTEKKQLGTYFVGCGIFAYKVLYRSTFFLRILSIFRTNKFVENHLLWPRKWNKLVVFVIFCAQDV